MSEDGAIQLLTPENIEQVIDSVQNELRQERGPNFYLLPGLFKEIGMSDEIQ
jgi:hypothetical protein